MLRLNINVPEWSKFERLARQTWFDRWFNIVSSSSQINSECRCIILEKKKSVETQTNRLTKSKTDSLRKHLVVPNTRKIKWIVNMTAGSISVWRSSWQKTKTHCTKAALRNDINSRLPKLLASTATTDTKLQKFERTVLLAVQTNVFLGFEMKFNMLRHQLSIFTA